ncbi:unnamed protein product [Vitrella brassicaformis CCMP3155]|uniref:Uncharacterized protein n=1 Tax=Vitrella brassicaformis (strain CCMP3155) TaxID=1169540 RepID=A0A0G4EL80_VITBC|nr:unnamed protein product [Vitrella brassicaformis CCMP3155]|eukprot:CEL97754.1 unnamed protein product [Vitrella brassicaformis CCMP3155]
MTKAVYAKIWASTAQATHRRNYGYYKLWSNLSKWAPFGFFTIGWFFFPAIPDGWKKFWSLGIWHSHRLCMDQKYRPYE